MLLPSCPWCSVPSNTSRSPSFDFTLALLLSGFPCWLVRNFSFDSRCIKNMLAMKRWKQLRTDSELIYTLKFQNRQIKNIILWSMKTLYNLIASSWWLKVLWFAGVICPLRFRQKLAWTSTEWKTRPLSISRNSWAGHILPSDLMILVIAMLNVQFFPTPHLWQLPFHPPFLAMTMASMWYVIQLLFSDFWKMPLIRNQIWVGDICRRFWEVRGGIRKLHSVIPASALSPSVSPPSRTSYFNLTSGHISGENSNLGKKNTLTPVFTQHYLIGKGMRKQLKCHQQMTGLRKLYIYVYIYYMCIPL